MLTLSPPSCDERNLPVQESLLPPWASDSPVAVWRGTGLVHTQAAGYRGVSSGSEPTVHITFPLWSAQCGSLDDTLAWSAAHGVDRVYVLSVCARGGVRFGFVDCVWPAVVKWQRRAKITADRVRRIVANAAQSYLSTRAFGAFCAAAETREAIAGSDQGDWQTTAEAQAAKVEAKLFAEIEDILARAGWQSGDVAPLPISLSEWCAAGANPTSRRNRRQALAALPSGVAKSLLPSLRANAPTEVQRFTAAIDSGSNVSEALAVWLRCNSSVAKALLRRRNVIPKRVSAPRLQRILGLLDATHDRALQAKYLPTTAAEWTRISRVQSLIDRGAAVTTVGGVTVSRYEWIAVAALRRYSLSDPRVTVAVKALIDIDDALHAFYSSLEAVDGLDAPDAASTRLRLVGLPFPELDAIANEALTGRVELTTQQLQRVIDDIGDAEFADRVAGFASWVDWMWALAPPPLGASPPDVTITPIRTLSELQTHALLFENCMCQALIQPERTIRSRWFYVLAVHGDERDIKHDALLSVLIDTVQTSTDDDGEVTALLDQIEGRGGAACADCVHAACSEWIARLNSRAYVDALHQMDTVADELGMAVLHFSLMWREFNMRKLLGDPAISRLQPL